MYYLTHCADQFEFFSKVMTDVIDTYHGSKLNKTVMTNHGALTTIVS